MLSQLERPRVWLTDRSVRKRYGNATGMTLWRWRRDPDLGFPKPVKIRGRNYTAADELDEFDRRCTERTAREAAG